MHAASFTDTLILLYLEKHGSENGVAVWSRPPTVALRAFHCACDTSRIGLEDAVVVASNEKRRIGDTRFIGM